MRSTILGRAVAMLSVASLLTLGTNAAFAQGSQATAVAQDRFGGVMVRVGKPSDSFRVQKIGTRWVFVTPDGNPFWMLGVFGVGPTGSIDDLKESRGVQMVVGTKSWAWTDDWGEKANWGLVSFLDNAYDGKEAIRARGKDQWGFPVGGEEKGYGDFLTTAREANARLTRQLRDDVARQIGSGTPTPQPERR
jgi:hypothetical protein